MDDRNFDQATALNWMKVIEDPNASVREKDLYPLLKSWLSRSSTDHVLDIGCGQGVCSAFLGNSVRYRGVDPSSDLIRRAQALYSDPARTFVMGNAYQLPFENKYFGAAFSIAVWHLLSDISKASSDLSRVLKNHGSFLIVTADPNQYGAWTERYQDRKIHGSLFTGTNWNADGTSISDTLYLRSQDELVEHLESNGLKVSAVERIRTFVVLSGYKE